MLGDNTTCFQWQWIFRVKGKRKEKRYARGISHVRTTVFEWPSYLLGDLYSGKRHIFTRPPSRRLPASWECRRRRPRDRGASCARGPARLTYASFGRNSTGSWTAATDRTRTSNDAEDYSANWRTCRTSGRDTPVCRPAVDVEDAYGPIADSRCTYVARSPKSTCLLENSDILSISRVNC